MNSTHEIAMEIAHILARIVPTWVGPSGIEFSVSGPPPGWFGGLGPLFRKQKHALFSAVT